MTSPDEITRAAARVKDALGAAADVMTVRENPMVVPARKARRAAGWLIPLAAAASVVLIVLAAVFVGRTSGTPAVPAAGGAAAPRPQFYMTFGWARGQSVLDVRRTADGAVTASASFRESMPQAGYLTADASDRAFFAALYPCTTGSTVSRFVRITVTGSGAIKSIGTVGSPVLGVVTGLAVSPDGSQMAYTQDQPNSCSGRGGMLMPQDAVHIMDLATGTVRTWRSTPAVAASGRLARFALLRDLVGGLSWTPDGRTLVINQPWSAFWLSGRHELTVLGLDTASSGGSLQAHSRVLWHQDSNCTACAQEALAGPGDSLTAAEVQPAGKQQSRQLIVRIPLATGRAPTVPPTVPPTVLYSALSRTPMNNSQAGLFADPSGRWVITWPLYDAYLPGWESHRAGWISGGTRHLLPGASPVYPNGITW
jgi:hypothetical protein